MAPLARSSDDMTSHRSAVGVVPCLASLQHRFVDALIALGKPSTAVEVAASIERDHVARETLRKRAGELLKAGLIREVGRRACSITHAMAREFVVAGWKCPDCDIHRSDAWLLGHEPAECPACDATRESVAERAAVIEFDSGLPRTEAETLALGELTK